jgi:hypothetical protein
MTALLIYDMPLVVWVACGAALLVVGILALVCAAAEIDNDYDEQEDRIINGRMRW